MMLLMVSFFVSGCNSEPEKRLHVLPEGARGWFFVLEKQEKGRGIIKSDEQVVYLYPKDRICKIKGSISREWGKDKFVTLNGIEIGATSDDNPNDIWIRGRESGGVEQGDKKITYMTFFIGTEEEFAKAKKQCSDFLDEMLEKYGTKPNK